MLKEAKTIANKLNNNQEFKKEFRKYLDNIYESLKDEDNGEYVKTFKSVYKYFVGKDIPRFNPIIISNRNNDPDCAINIWGKNNLDDDWYMYTQFAYDKFQREFKSIVESKYSYIDVVYVDHLDSIDIFIKRNKVIINESTNLLDW